MIETKFKNTEIGRIPEDWKVGTLAEFASVLNGDRSERYPQDEEIIGQGVPFVNAGHIVNGKLDFSHMDYISYEKYNSLSGVKFRENDILVCIRGSLGKNTKIDFSVGTVASSLCVVRPKGIDPDYLFSILNSSYFDKFIKEENNGSSQPNLSAQSMFGLKFPVPSHREQYRIAGAISSIESLIYNLDRTIEKKQNIRQGAMEQLLSCKSDWVECELSEIINVIKGVQLNGSELLEDGPYPMINGGVEPSGYTTNFNRNAETITISEGGNSCGYVNFIHQKFWAGGHCYCVVIRKNVEIEKDFLYHLLKNSEKAIMAMRVGSGLPNVQSKTLLAMRVSYPADIKEQRAIADTLTAMDDEIAVLQMERDKYANIRSGMMDDLLTGTKRL